MGNWYRLVYYNYLASTSTHIYVEKAESLKPDPENGLPRIRVATHSASKVPFDFHFSALLDTTKDKYEILSTSTKKAKQMIDVWCYVESCLKKKGGIKLCFVELADPSMSSSSTSIYTTASSKSASSSSSSIASKKPLEAERQAVAVCCLKNKGDVRFMLYETTKGQPNTSFVLTPLNKFGFILPEINMNTFN